MKARFWTLAAAALALVLVGAACASKGALEQTQQSLVAAQGELTKAKTDLATAAQQIKTLEEQFKAAQAALLKAQADNQQALTGLQDGQKGLKDSLDKAARDLAGVTADAASLKTSLGTVQSDQTRMRSDLGTATGDVARLKTDLTTANTSLSDLKNSFLLTRDDVGKLKDDVTKVKADVTKLTTPVPAEVRASLAILALNLYYLAKEMNFLSDYRTAAVRVGDVVKGINDSALAAAWTKVDADWIKLVGTQTGTPEFEAARREWWNSEDAFLSRLLQLILG